MYIYITPTEKVHVIYLIHEYIMKQIMIKIR